MDDKFMSEDIRLSEEKMMAGHGGPFGAVIVQDGKIIAQGYNQVTSTNDPTAHAEIVAIRQACEKLQNFRLDNCKIYASCEPCPMCLAAIYWAGIKTVYYAATREDAARIGFADDHIYQEFAKPMEERQMTMIPLNRQQALPVMATWQQMEEKITY